MYIHYSYEIINMKIRPDFAHCVLAQLANRPAVSVDGRKQVKPRGALDGLDRRDETFERSFVEHFRVRHNERLHQVLARALLHLLVLAIRRQHGLEEMRRHRDVRRIPNNFVPNRPLLRGVVVARQVQRARNHVHVPVPRRQVPHKRLEKRPVVAVEPVSYLRAYVRQHERLVHRLLVDLAVARWRHVAPVVPAPEIIAQQRPVLLRNRRVLAELGLLTIPWPPQRILSQMFCHLSIISSNITHTVYL
ncbi:hypothetical protein AYI69_g2236 [Smittium culicis]|uniref:Uncharacterized protein n=1 Tax=Smittium culicis TaxID=133412 RepID=A0A1R1YN05_9FUNG|nr:hypothetical protein AYI69_g2236 [Smittium culicis]